MSIKMGELIEVGKVYHSRAGNVIRIEEAKEVIDAHIRQVHFRGTIIETIEGHQVLLNKTHWFNEKGKWLKHIGGIHDLVKLCTLPHG
jgi:hypothetical protein